MARYSWQGKIRAHRVYDVNCAHCPKDEDLGMNTRRGAEKDARELGWRLREEGWVCPRCVKGQTPQ